jgi:hypothetical protein
MGRGLPVPPTRIQGSPEQVIDGYRDHRHPTDTDPGADADQLIHLGMLVSPFA